MNTNLRLIIGIIACTVMTDKISADIVGGTVWAVYGNVMLVSDSGETHPVNLKSKITMGSTLLTGPNAIVIIHWMWGADSVLNNGTKLSVITLENSLHGASLDRKIVLRLESGALYDFITDEPGNLEFRIKTSDATYTTKASRHRLVVVDKVTTPPFHLYKNEMAVQSGEVEEDLFNGASLIVTGGHQGNLTWEGSDTFSDMSLNPIVKNLSSQVEGLASADNANITEILGLLDPNKPVHLEDIGLGQPGLLNGGFSLNQEANSFAAPTPASTFSSASSYMKANVRYMTQMDGSQ